MNLDKIKANNYIKLCIYNKDNKSYYHICQIKNFILQTNKLDSTIQLHAVHPRNAFIHNSTYRYETLLKLGIKDVDWTPAEKLMKLIYG